MPPIVSASRQRYVANGMVNGSQAPPSSLIAALAPADGSTFPNFDRDGLALLLKESLGSDEDGQPNLGTDVNLNHELIRVIVKEGLDTLDLRSDDPFHRDNNYCDRIHGCIQVIGLVVEKTPEALFVFSKSEDLGSRAENVPLFSWVIPRLISLLSLDQVDSKVIKESVWSLLGKMLAAAKQCPNSLDHCISISAYLEELLEGLLSYFGQIKIPERMSHSGPILLPIQSEFFANSLAKLNLRDAKLPYNIRLGDLPKGIDIACGLLRLLASSVCSQSRTTTTAMKRCLVTILGQNQRLWNFLVGVLDFTSDKEYLFPGLIDRFFHGLQDLVLFPFQSRWQTSVQQRLHSLWAQSIVDITHIVQASSSTAITEIIVAVLDITVNTSFRAPGLAFVANEILQPTMKAFFDKKIAQPSTYASIQASLSQLSKLSMQNGFEIAVDQSASSRHQPGFEALSWPNDGRPCKRLRLSSAEHILEPLNQAQQLRRRLNVLLFAQDTVEVCELGKTAIDNFRSSAEIDQCRVFELLGELSCAESTEPTRSGVDVPMPASNCSICDGQLSTRLVGKPCGTEPDQLINSFIVLVPLVQRSAKARLVAMLALRRLLAHTSCRNHLDVSNCAVGEWCLQSLRSSSRELRISAASTLKTFVAMSSRVGYELIHRNRVATLDFLTSLWSINTPSLQETTILALTEVATVGGDEELNIVLVRFVEFLGHPNPYISGLVYAELQKLARNMKLTPSSLLRPFWRTIAVVVVKNFQTRPIIAQSLCDFLSTGMNVDVLLMFIEEYALPYLILTRKKDVVLRIALAHGQTMSPFDLCTQSNNFAAILSYLLTQSGAEAEGLVMSLLVDTSTEFRQQDLSAWIKLEPILIACELLKSIVDAGSERSSKPYHGLQLLAQLDVRRGSGSNGSRRSEVVATFLENHVLGIITQFTVTFNDSQSRQPNLEKRRCLAAIGELLKLGQHRIACALPQICACLRSAMEMRDLSDEAFKSWALMMTNLPENDVEPLIDQTLAVIVQNWHVFQDATQKAAHELIAKIWVSNRASVLGILATMPSLSSIPLLSQFESEISDSKKQMDHRQQMMAFSHRLRSENVTLVQQALKELIGTLDAGQEWLHQSLLREQPEPVIADLTRSILDCCVKFNANTAVAGSCGKALGKIGYLDPNRIDTVKEKRSVLAISNFGRADETVDFIMFFLEEVLVKAFLSAPNTRAQGFLAWAMQELLKICGLEETVALRSRSAATNSKYRGWWDLDETVRTTLTPFLNSRYSLNVAMVRTQCSYPLFDSKEMSHKDWLEAIVLDLLTRAPGDNIQMIFTICLRIIRFQDISISIFLLPFAALNLFVAGSAAQQDDKKNFLNEMIAILRRPLSGTQQHKENVKLCSQRVFDVLDYISKWLQQRRKQFQAALARNERGIADHAAELAQVQIRNVEIVLEEIPPDLISSRAIECRSYSRALFHWEQYIRQMKESKGDPDDLLARLQEIYTQIDEPDGIEGISTQMHTLSIDQQILEHQKAGNWAAAQNWYEIQLQERPDDGAVQMNLLTCLKETGQSGALLNQFESFEKTHSFSRVVPFAVEAAWTNNNWKKLSQIIDSTANKTGDFNVGVGAILQALHHKDHDRAATVAAELRLAHATSLTATSASSLQSCHDILLRLHVLEDLETISFAAEGTESLVLANLDRRIESIGADVSTKQYMLSLRRAAMSLSPIFTDLDIASGWLATAKLARKSSFSNQAFNAILHATALGEESATIEHAKLLWRDGYHRKAIHILEGAIDSGAFVSHNLDSEDMTLTSHQIQQQNVVVAKAHLMLAKWLDSADQTQSEIIQKQYRKATEFHRRWDKGWYYLGKHYNKILDSEKTKTAGKEAQSYLTGEASKLVIDNYLRALGFGSKYVFQTLPKVLTLWLELVATSEQPQDARRGNEKFTIHLSTQRKKVVDDTNAQIKKYVDRLQPVMLYTILSQVVARIGHSDKTVTDILINIVVKVLKAFPQQAIWTVLALAKSSSKDRASRGLTILSKVVEVQRRSGRDASAAELREVIKQGQSLSGELLRIADHELRDPKATHVSLSRELKFNHKIAPCRLVVPIEACLIPSMPNNQDAWPPKNFRAFSREPITVEAFLDDALVLSSLQKPRKLSIRGSDGKLYAVLAKPKDDLRKDQRLMEFNTMINRFLKRDVEASKRRLYIRTYAVVPLNEECGLIEWVNNLKTFRDILLRLYKERGINPNYAQIRALLDEACNCAPEKTAELFESRILTLFPGLFHDWFVETFPEPGAWFSARLRYTRSCAVMSIVGHVLGLGDRHGENILFEEDNGGTLHVDFNCLFDKGMTFEKPEMVPFRLTHNMVDAFGAYGYDGPFRRCCEITLTLLRGNEDALMTILETFLYDPTTDFIGGKKRRTHPNVPNTPQEVLDGVRSKTRGMLDGESVPLSVGGYVDEMIKRATDQNRLARMYIGWCAFF